MSGGRADRQGGGPPAALAREVRADLAALAARFPVFDRARLPALALTIAAHVPDLARADRELLALVPLWLFAFDDLVDGDLRGGGQVQGPEVAALVAGYKAIVRGGAGAGPFPGPRPPGPAGELGLALAELAARLAAYRSFGGALAAYWHASFDLAVDGIVRDRARSARLRLGSGRPPEGEAPLPTYAEWLATAQHSVGVHPYLAACFIIYSDPTLARRLPALARITDACGRALRLANDLRTWEKEEREGNFNTVAALRAEIGRARPALTPAERQSRALRDLEGRLAAQVAETRALLATSPVPDGAVEASIARLVAFVIPFYAAHDYHTFRPEPFPTGGPGEPPR